jgi:ABC-2 type transport system permease protein
MTATVAEQERMAVQAQAADAPSLWSASIGVVTAVWLREMLRVVRDPARPVGVVLQPVVFWMLFGSGLRDVFTIQTAPGVDYAAWFYPGAIAMTILFSSIFGTITVIEDRQAGFLQAFLVAPAWRGAVAMGKLCGVGTTVAAQVLVFMAVAAIFGHAPPLSAWGGVAAAVAMTTVFLLAGTILLAWWSRSSHAYHAVMSAVLLPSWVISGAMFPVPGGVLGVLMACNPMTWHVDVLRAACGMGGAEGMSPVSLGLAVGSTLVAVVALLLGVRRVRNGGAE